MVLVFCFVDEFLAFVRIYEKVFFIRDLVNAFLLYHQQPVCFNPFGGCSLGKDQIGKEGVVMLDLRTPASYKKRACARCGLYQLRQRWMAGEKLRGDCRHASASETNQ